MSFVQNVEKVPFQLNITHNYTNSKYVKQMKTPTQEEIRAKAEAYAKSYIEPRCVERVYTDAYTQALTDMQQPLDKPKLIDLLTDTENGITEDEDMELCNILETNNCRFFLLKVLWDKHSYSIDAVKAVKAYVYLSDRYELPGNLIQPAQRSDAVEIFLNWLSKEWPDHTKTLADKHQEFLNQKQK